MGLMQAIRLDLGFHKKLPAIQDDLVGKDMHF